MSRKKLAFDRAGNKVQGFEPTDVIAGTINIIDVREYVAFSPSEDVNVTYTIDGVAKTPVSLGRGAIRVCINMDSIQCDSAVNIEVM